tara:strand:- start:293 stop:550 length:258 start_codon:yes stop_codon:yes gene_type:complete
MKPEQLDRWRFIPRIMMLSLIIMNFRVIEWFMGLDTPTMEQAGMLSIMTGALTAAFGLYLGNTEKTIPAESKTNRLCTCNETTKK